MAHASSQLFAFPPFPLQLKGSWPRNLYLPRPRPSQTPCAFEALNYTACAVTNFTSSCICRDGGYIEMYRLCVRASCDMAHALSEFLSLLVTWVVFFTSPLLSLLEA